jgi:hypothetical protein
VGVAFLTTELIMIVTVTMAFDLDDLLDSLDLELVDAEDNSDFEIDFDIDEDGVIWSYDEESDILYYFDEDLEDWAEVDEDDNVWYVDEDDILYFYDDESDEWIECEDEDVAAW